MLDDTAVNDDVPVSVVGCDREVDGALDCELDTVDDCNGDTVTAAEPDGDERITVEVVVAECDAVSVVVAVYNEDPELVVEGVHDCVSECVGESDIVPELVDDAATELLVDGEIVAVPEVECESEAVTLVDGNCVFVRDTAAETLAVNDGDATSVPELVRERDGELL